MRVTEYADASASRARDQGLWPLGAVRREIQPVRVSDPFRLQRFLDAQNDGGTYYQALRELEAGEKRSHWMWFVFPQLTGLGRSPIAQHYAISGIEEARAYLAHPVLGQRLVDCARALVALGEKDPERVFDPVDAQKLHSSMTLFAAAAPDEVVFAAVLDQYFHGKLDPGTTGLL
jgi:uncharacterized protein (DUF1810 family)